MTPLRQPGRAVLPKGRDANIALLQWDLDGLDLGRLAPPLVVDRRQQDVLAPRQRV
jgi:hypothetical protein